jgi:hypothetical protein
MAMSAVKESPFFKNLICSSFDYLPATHDLAGEIIVLPAVAEKAWPRRAFVPGRQNSSKAKQFDEKRTLQASVCMTGAAHYGAMENYSPQLRCSPIQTAENAKRLLSSVRVIRSTPNSGFHFRAISRADAGARARTSRSIRNWIQSALARRSAAKIG